tara:strand:+ start:154 stop:501 length:348 start_codon:yes stop_codon:yes gene_type:complete
MSSNNDILLKITDKFEEAIHAALMRSNYINNIFNITDVEEKDKYEGSEGFEGFEEPERSEESERSEGFEESEDESSFQELPIEETKRKELEGDQVSKLLDGVHNAANLDALLLAI